MLKSKIKIILIGLFSLLVMGLVFSLLNAKPEIIADESLATEEPAVPGMESQIARAAKIDSMSASQIESSLENKLIDQPVASYRNELASDDSKQAVDKSGQSEEGVAKEQLNEASVPMTVAENEARMLEAAASVSPFKNDSTPSGVTSEPTPMQSNHDFLTFEEVNDESNVDALVTKREQQPDRSGDVMTAPDTSDFLDLNHLGDDIKQSNSFSQADSEIMKRSLDKPSVFAVPEVDQELMHGNDEISKQYRQTMSKLISINTQLHAADEENAVLKSQFSMAVNHNRKLAQIIRDIDIQIKTFTSTN